MDEASLLAQLGFHVPALIAGFMGGVANSFLFKQSTPVSIIGTCVVGAITANYTALSVVQLIGTSIGFTAFAIGLGGMAVVQILYDKVLGTATNINPPVKPTPEVPNVRNP